MRTGTSAHLPGFGGCVVRGPPGPHLGSAPGRNADEDVRAPARVRRRRGARTSRSALGLAPGRNADEDVRAPPRVRRRRGARTSRSAFGLRTRPECGRGRPRTSQGFGGCVVRGPPGPQWASHRARVRTRTSAHLPGFGGCGGCGRPGPRCSGTGPGWRPRRSVDAGGVGSGQVREVACRARQEAHRDDVAVGLDAQAPLALAVA